jgi:nicotinamide-nucleotide amidase
LAIEVNPNPFSKGGKVWLILLPGPPREMRPMFTESVLPLIRREMPLAGPFECRTLRTAGLGESLVEQKVAPPLAPLLREGLEIGYCARVGEVDVRLIAHGAKAKRIVSDAEKIVRDALGEVLIFGTDWDLMESVIVRLLTERHKTLSLAESCTGGYIANRVTNVPGASAVFKAGLVTYSNESKQQLLGVRAETLERHGAVSEEVAREMAEGARARLKTDYAIAITGIAGPSGGSEAKPVGTVFMAVAEEGRTTVRKQFNNFDRETFKFISSQQAMSFLRERLIGK